MHIFPGNIYYYKVRRSKKNMAKLNGHSVSSIRTYVPRVMLSNYYHLPPPPEHSTLNTELTYRIRRVQPQGQPLGRLTLHLLKLQPHAFFHFELIKVVFEMHEERERSEEKGGRGHPRVQKAICPVHWIWDMDAL